MEARKITETQARENRKNKHRDQQLVQLTSQFFRFDYGRSRSPLMRVLSVTVAKSRLDDIRRDAFGRRNLFRARIPEDHASIAGGVNRTCHSFRPGGGLWR
jgi:hypothetical protein